MANRKSVSSIELAATGAAVWMCNGDKGKACFGVWCLWWFQYPGLFLHTELIVSLFIRCTMRCEIWASVAQLVNVYTLTGTCIYMYMLYVCMRCRLSMGNNV